MTVPIARVVATRYATAEPPLRFCYFANVYRGVRPHRGQMREFLQAGIELVGAPAPDGHGRGADRAVPRARRGRAARLPRSALGDASLYPALLRRLGVRRRRDGVLDALVAPRLRRRSSTRRPRSALDARRDPRRHRSAAAAPRCSRASPGDAVERPARGATSCSTGDVAARVIFDLGLVRGLGYYTGAVFEVYDPALGEPLGGGGRYDDLLGALRPRRCPRSASRSASTRCTSRWRARSVAAMNRATA